MYRRFYLDALGLQLGRRANTHAGDQCQYLVILGRAIGGRIGVLALAVRPDGLWMMGYVFSSMDKGFWSSFFSPIFLVSMWISNFKFPIGPDPEVWILVSSKPGKASQLSVAMKTHVSERNAVSTFKCSESTLPCRNMPGVRRRTLVLCRGCDVRSPTDPHYSSPDETRWDTFLSCMASRSTFNSGYSTGGKRKVILSVHLKTYVRKMLGGEQRPPANRNEDA